MALDMDPSERQTLFKFYWAASMMPKRSTCFVRMESESCRQELTKWMSREAAGDPRFLLDYKTLAPALGLACAGRYRWFVRRLDVVEPIRWRLLRRALRIDQQKFRLTVVKPPSKCDMSTSRCATRWRTSPSHCQVP